MDLVTVVLIALFIIVFGVVLFILIAKVLKGSIQIILKRSDFVEGETVEGILRIKLRKAIAADQILVGMTAFDKEVMYSGKEVSTHSESRIVFENQVYGKTNLKQGTTELKFKMKIPLGITKGIKTGNKFVDMAVKFFSGPSVRWYLHARVSCPGFDLKGKAPIVLGEESFVMTTA